ncbi:hypothetical protein ACTWP5_12045 [Streptomyces sp. 4N509B]|uniref:hypothetical protein n=1 Tax=Streptomyces sp. 4N509B TaxID=3457413 RepID=UPI003FCF12F5
MGEKNRRRAVRAAGVTAGAVLVTLLSSPAAHALRRDDGDDPGSGLSIAETLGLFVLTPLLLFAVIAGLVVLADRRR